MQSCSRNVEVKVKVPVSIHLPKTLNPDERESKSHLSTRDIEIKQNKSETKNYPLAKRTEAGKKYLKCYQLTTGVNATQNESES